MDNKRYIYGYIEIYENDFDWFLDNMFDDKGYFKLDYKMSYEPSITKKEAIERISQIRKENMKKRKRNEHRLSEKMLYDSSTPITIEMKLDILKLSEDEIVTLINTDHLNTNDTHLGIISFDGPKHRICPKYFHKLGYPWMEYKDYKYAVENDESLRQELLEECLIYKTDMEVNHPELINLTSLNIPVKTIK